MSKIFLIRHGQASYQSDDYDQLSDLGYEQAYTLGQSLVQDKISPDKVFIGALKRHRQTCEGIRKAYIESGLAFPAIEVLPSLNEHQAPEVLSIIKPQLVTDDTLMKEWHAASINQPDQRIRFELKIFARFLALWCDGELAHLHPSELQDWASFRAQCAEAYRDIMAYANANRSTTTLVVTSGGTISALIGTLMDIEQGSNLSRLATAIYNASLTRISTHPDLGSSLISFNEIYHFNKRPLITLI